MEFGKRKSIITRMKTTCPSPEIGYVEGVNKKLRVPVGTSIRRETSESK